MKAVWRFIRRWWWTILIGVAIVGGVVLWVLTAGRSNSRKKEPTPGEPPIRTFKDIAVEQVERVRLEGEVEKARAMATADAQRAEIDRIEEMGQTDPAEARRQMAAVLGAMY